MYRILNQSTFSWNYITTDQKYQMNDFPYNYEWNSKRALYDLSWSQWIRREQVIRICNFCSFKVYDQGHELLFGGYHPVIHQILLICVIAEPDYIIVGIERTIFVLIKKRRGKFNRKTFVNLEEKAEVVAACLLLQRKFNL